MRIISYGQSILAKYRGIKDTTESLKQEMKDNVFCTPENEYEVCDFCKTEMPNGRHPDNECKATDRE